jgi:hypothetical protein
LPKNSPPSHPPRSDLPDQPRPCTLRWRVGPNPKCAPQRSKKAPLSHRLSISRSSASDLACPESRRREGRVKKVDRAREGKVWVGYFHVWEATRGASACAARRRRLSGPLRSRSMRHSMTLPSKSPSTRASSRNKANRFPRSPSFGMPFAL